MDQPVTITRRDVKHARLRVREDCAVELIIPQAFTDAQVTGVLARKARWIEEKKRFFREHPAPVQRLGTHEVPLFGGIYRFIHDPALRGRERIDTAERTLRSGARLDQPGDRQRWYRRFAGRYLRQRLAHHAAAHGFTVGRVFVLNQRRRWGSCTRSGNITLNWRLVTAPEYVVDYVILHELVHTVEMSHGQRFWVRLRTLCRHTDEAVRWLNSNRTVAPPPGQAPTS